MNLQETKMLIERYSIRPTRSLGQNFLIDDRVVNRMRDVLVLKQDDIVFEIGPGLGTLTRELACAGTVIAIEIDRHMVEVLTATMSELDSVNIVHADALKVDLCSFANDSDNVKVAANLPYYITTQLIEKLIIELAQAEIMILMMQKEASERLFALPGNKLYGPVSVLTSLYGNIEKLQKVSASSYYPRPHVDSIIVKLTRSAETKQSEDISANKLNSLSPQLRRSFHSFLNTCFSQRRKIITNVIKNSQYSMLVHNGYAAELMKINGISETARAEQIPPQMYLELFLRLCNS